MGRTARDNRDRPHPKPVQKIELPDGSSIKRRLIATCLFLLIGGVALGYAFSRLMTPESGWQAIEAGSAAGANCGGDFEFLYELGAGGESPTAENRAVSALYTDACRRMFQLFHTMESFEGVTNLRDINLHPNETLEVDGVLYEAFAAIQRHGSRAIYLGPVYARYDDLFSCENDSQLVDFDPRLSESVRREYGEIAAFAADPQSIDVQLLGGNQVRLYVSEEYLAYAREEEIENFIDFFWMKNAFIVDYLAQVMTDNGYTHGFLSSYDGFIRNLDQRGTGYSLNVYDRAEGGIYLAATMEYQGPLSAVCLRNYPLSSADSPRYYQLSSGEVRTPYLDVQDGLCKSALNDLTSYSKSQSCAELLLCVSPIYISDTFDRRALSALAGEDVHSIYCEDRVIFGSDPDLALTNLYEQDEIRYTASLN